MKKYMLAVLLILMTAFILCSCGSADLAESADSFEQISIGKIMNVGDVIKLKALEEQYYTLIVFKQDSVNDFLVYDSHDGGRSWEIEQLAWLGDMEFTEASCAITSVDRNAAGDYLVSYDVLNDAYERVRTVVCVVSGGEASEIAVFDDSSNLITGKFIGDKIGINCEDMLIFYDFSGNELVSIENEGIVDFCEYGDGLLVVTEEDLTEYDQNAEKVRDYKGISGTIIDGIRAICDENYMRQLRRDIVSAGAGESAYILMSDGIYRVYMENDVVERVVSDEKIFLLQVVPAHLS